MPYREFQPHISLQNYISCYWILENDSRLAEPEPLRIFPDGCMELIFHYKDRVRRLTNGAVPRRQDELQAAATLSGQIKKFILLQPTGQLGVLGIRFRPAGALPFFRMPIAELTEKVVPVESLWGNSGKQLYDQIASAPLYRDKIRIIENFLLKRVERPAARDALILEALREIRRHNGEITVDFLMRKMKISGRHLERKFSEQVGLSPKRFSRIVRFQNIFRVMNQPAVGRLTELALAVGYYDQAHFIREFKEFAGLNPSAYFSKPHPLTDCFTGANEMADLYKSVS
ncbi:MAG TPA: helix-turn-helix domain-containing protein [bacterium]